MSKYQPLAFIPNKAGFEFVGVTKEQGRMACTVQQGEDGLCYVVDEQGNRCFSKLVGWIK